MDMTPYIGRVRLACPRETCLDRTKARPDAECVFCQACDAEIIDLEGNIVAVFSPPRPPAPAEGAAAPRTSHPALPPKAEKRTPAVRGKEE